MAYPNPKFFAMPALQQTYFNKISGGAFGSGTTTDGGVLSSGVLTFYRDIERQTLKPVYQISDTPSPEYEYVELPNPLTLSGTGCIINPSTGQEIIPYLYPYQDAPEDESNIVDLYYITVISSGGLEQTYAVAWPSGVTVPASENDLVGAQNLLTNPQFSEILFSVTPSTGTKVYTVSGSSTVTPVAPGWDMITTGSGTVTVSQVSVTSTTASTNPPYALDIQGGGSLTLLRLRQRLNNSPRLAANGFVSASFIVNSQDSDTHDLTLTYTPSTGSAHEIISFTTTGALAFEAASGAVAINGTINSDNATGYVDILLNMPALAHLQLSSFQMTQVSGADTFPPFYQQSTDEQKKDLYWYWEPYLKFKPIPSLAVAWDFPLNPAQFAASSVSVTTTPAYVWDKTIMSRTGGANVTVTRKAETGGMSCATTTAGTAFYFLQYFSGASAQEFLKTLMSVNIYGWTTTSLTHKPVVRVYLYRGAAAASFPTLGTTIGTLGSDGTFTLTASNWTEIPRSSQGEAIGQLQNAAAFTLLNGDIDLRFSGWQITDGTQIGDTNKTAMVVTVYCEDASNTVIIDSMSLALGNIPTRPAPLTQDEVIRECQYEYEKTWNISTAVATATETNAILTQMLIFPEATSTSTTARLLCARSFLLRYKQTKLAAPTITFYSTSTGTSGQVRGKVLNSGAVVTTGDVAVATYWTETGKGLDCVYYRASNINGSVTTGSITGDNAEAFILYHATIDSRLGIV